MGKFCRKCGTENEANAKFCESCGTEFVTASSAATQSIIAKEPVKRFTPTRAAGVQPKMLAMIAGTVIALVIVGGLAIYLNGSSALSNSEAKARIEEKLGTREGAEQLVCIGNMPYDRSEIRVGSEDAGTQKWMDMLVRAGIFNAPSEETSGTYFLRTQLVYAKSVSANAALLGKKLCFADGLEVASIVNIGESEKADKRPKRVVRWQAKLKNPASWIKDEFAQNGIANLASLINGTHEMTTPFMFGERHWQIDNAAPSVNTRSDPFADMLGRSSKAQPSQLPDSNGLWSKLSSMFSVSDAPGEVAKKFVAAGSAGDTRAFFALFPSAWQKDHPLDATSSLEPPLFKGVKSITVVNEKISGDTAVVTINTGTSGRLSNWRIPLIKEDGKWKIDIEKM